MESLDWYSKSLHMFSTTGDWNLKHFGSNVTHKGEFKPSSRLLHKLCFQPWVIEIWNILEVMSHRKIYTCIVQCTAVVVNSNITLSRVVALLDVCVVTLYIQLSCVWPKCKSPYLTVKKREGFCQDQDWDWLRPQFSIALVWPAQWID